MREIETKDSPASEGQTNQADRLGRALKWCLTDSMFQNLKAHSRFQVDMDQSVSLVLPCVNEGV